MTTSIQALFLTFLNSKLCDQSLQSVDFSEVSSIYQDPLQNYPRILVGGITITLFTLYHSARLGASEIFSLVIIRIANFEQSLPFELKQEPSTSIPIFFLITLPKDQFRKIYS